MQAEDRAYRIGQTRTVNVTYMTAADTIDDFVQGVLERKRALMSAIVDGQALAPDVSGDVLDELQRAVRALASTSLDASGDASEDDLVDRLIQQARLTHSSPVVDVEGEGRTVEEAEAFRKALLTLAKALSRPQAERYRFTSTSHPGVEYEVTIDGADVTCTCPGFEYRGQCRHARDIKAAIGAGLAVPGGYRRS